jgi:peptidoglycan hydrolase-like protein with peptidoglycan-binding domain
MRTQLAASDFFAMKKFVSLFVFPLLLASAALADDQLRSAQTALKSQGFFYGDVNGQASAETTAAIRRYQIRNGLEVTGTLNKETLDALNLAPKQTPQVAPPATPAPAKKPPVNLRKDDAPEEESDREYLEKENPPPRRPPEAEARFSAPYVPPQPEPYSRDPYVVRPPVPMDAPSNDFPVLFARTPYATAPLEVQQRVLRNAQAILASRGFYRDIVDGLPGPGTEEALLTYQRSARLVLTGRLDMPTLSALRLLPGNTMRNPAPPPPQRVYRGVWVN